MTALEYYKSKYPEDAGYITEDEIIKLIEGYQSESQVGGFELTDSYKDATHIAQTKDDYFEPPTEEDDYILLIQSTPSEPSDPSPVSDQEIAQQYFSWLNETKMTLTKQVVWHQAIIWYKSKLKGG